MKKHFQITVGDKTYTALVEEVEESPAVPMQSVTASTPSVAPPPSSAQPKMHSPGEIASPLAGAILKINVKVGDTVEPGQALIVLEAMKMENIIHSSFSGTVKSISVSVGDAVEEGQALMMLS